MKRVIFFLSIAVFAVTVILPIFTVVLSSFFQEGRFSLHSYFQVIDAGNLALLFRSAALALSIAVLSTLSGGFMAFFLSRTDFPQKGLFRLLLLTPLFLSPYILAVSWVDFFVLMGTGKSFIYSLMGVIFVLTMIFSPLAILIISSGLANINAALEEAGLMIGSYGAVLRRIVFPLVKPAVLSSFVLIFILSLSEFSVPAFLSVNVFTTEIFTQFAAFYNYDLAIANSMILILVCVSLLLMEQTYLADAPFIAIGVKAHRVRITELGKFNLPVLLIFLIYLFISVFIPIMVLIYQTFRGGLKTFVRALELLSSTIPDSLIYAFAGAVVLSAFGFVFAYFSVREKAQWIDRILLLSFAVPSTVLGIGLIRFFNRPGLDYIYAGFGMIIMVYLGRFIFIAEKLIANALKQVPESLEEAARLTGAGYLQRMRKIVFPQISGGFFAAFVIGFIFCIGELGAAILVYPPGTSLMPIKVYTIMANAPQSLTSAMSLIVLAITLLALIGLYFGYKFRTRKTGVAV